MSSPVSSHTRGEELDLFHSMEVLFPEYFQGIYGIFPYHEKHFHTMELDKTMETFLQYFQYISYYGRGIIFPVHVPLVCFTASSKSQNHLFRSDSSEISIIIWHSIATDHQFAIKAKFAANL